MKKVILTGEDIGATYEGQYGKDGARTPRHEKVRPLPAPGTTVLNEVLSSFCHPLVGEPMPEISIEFVIGWWEANMDASAWWTAESVTPINAAILLHGLNPRITTENEAAKTVTDETKPEDFGFLKILFEGAIKQNRTLKEWADYASQHRLKVHSWLDEWVQVSGKQAIQNKQNDQEGVPSARMIEHFHLEDSWNNKLRHWKSYGFLKPPVLAQPGARGNGRGKNLWNPAQFAKMLMDRDKRKYNYKRMNTIIEDHFDRWLDEWQEISGWNDV